MILSNAAGRVAGAPATRPAAFERFIFCFGSVKCFFFLLRNRHCPYMSAMELAIKAAVSGSSSSASESRSASNSSMSDASAEPSMRGETSLVRLSR